VTDGIKLECEYKENPWNEKECILENIEIDEKMLRDQVEISTKNSTKLVHYDGVFVSSTSCYWYFIPKEIFKEMPSLKSFVANFIALKKLYHNTFENAGELRILELASNSIASLKIEIFSYLGNLEQLNLNGNPILHIDLDIFTWIPNLKFVDLRLTGCSNDFFVIENNNYKPMKLKLMKCYGSDVTVHDVIGDDNSTLIIESENEETAISKMWNQKLEEAKVFITGNRMILASFILMTLILVLGVSVMIAVCKRI
jgi:hypothetical protein